MSPLAFATVFVGGLMIWFGVGALSLVGRALRRLLRGRCDWRRRVPAADESIPPGHEAFLPLALGLGLLAGTIAGLVPQATSFWFACAVHLTVGLVYGSTLRALARNGYLPFSEPE